MEVNCHYFKDAIFLDELNVLIKKLLIDNFKLSNVSKSIHYKILSYLITSYFEFGIKNISMYDLKKLNLSNKKIEIVVKELASKGLVKVSGCNVSLGGCVVNTIFNLIKIVQNFDKEIEQILKGIEDKDLKLSELKKLAINFLKGKNFLSYFEKSIVYALFEEYIYRANERKIILKRKGKDLEEILKDLEIKKETNDLLILDYKTRFNDEVIVKKQIVKLKNIIKEATKHYQYALFITLTTNPQKKDILEGYKEISKAFKKFRDAISRKLGESIKYIKVLEFTKSGLPHLHILIFVNRVKDKKGNWVISQKWISRIWEKYGFGKIVYIYALKRQGETYTWLNFKPAKAKTNNIANYLSKYLEKAFKEDLELMYYWVSNLRFYTYSYSLYKDNKENKENKKIWEFLGAVKEDLIIEYLKELQERYKYYKEKENIERWYSTIEGIYKYWVCV